MENLKYKHLFAPIKVGNRLLKNRLVSTPSGMHMNRASEPFATDNLKSYYEGKARNGAAMMVVNGVSMDYNPKNDDPNVWDMDVTNPRNRAALADLVDGIHMNSCLATVNFHLMLPTGYDVSGGVPNQWLSMHGLDWGENNRVDLQTATLEMLEQCAEEYTDMVAALAHDCGFDGCFLHMAYRLMPLGRFLSPLTNKRTDKYGGSPENRMRYPLEIAEKIKRKCGKNFLIEASMSGIDPANEPGGLTPDDVAEYVKMAKGYFDIIQIKAPDLDPAHPIQFHERTPWLDLVAEVREKSGRAVPIMCVGGFTHPDDAERALAEDKTDLVGMARSWISNPEWVKCIQEDRVDDIVPCLRCNKCHRTSDADPLLPACSVNPTYGIENKLPRIVKPAERAKKLAVVGGGPAGMRTAMFLSDRGHDVTIFEKEAELGGQLNVTKDVPFKWTLQDYRKYLIYQVSKKGIRVKLNTAATSEMLAAEHYDEVFICVGAEPAIPPIPGVDNEQVMTALNVYKNPQNVGQRVVIIGGGEIGVETGIYLASMGRDVTVMEQRSALAMDSTPIHYYSMFKAEWKKYSNFHEITNAKVISISEHGVEYQNTEGDIQSVEYDTVVVSAGMKPKTADAEKVFVPGVKCHLVGDCNKVGNIQKVNRNAFGVTCAV